MLRLSSRMPSLDAFRGITITMMIFVNNPGSWNDIYSPLKHAEWNGWTLTDTVFPFFIFIMGVSIVLAFTKKCERGIDKKDLYKEIFSRTWKLFGLGLLLNLLSIDLLTSNHHWITDTLFHVRIMGVLQRLALVYLATSLLYLNVRPITLITIGILILLVYWYVLLCAPFSAVIQGHTVDLTGSLEPGKNFAAWLDNLLLGSNHVYVNKNTVIPYDPEGLLPTLTAIVSCMAGVLTGIYLKKGEPLFKQVLTLLICGVLLFLSGSLMDYGLPVNKTLWTPAYVLLMTGLALIFLSICRFFFDNKPSGLLLEFFNVFGMNAIFFFVFSGVLARLVLMIRIDGIRVRDWLFIHFFAPLTGNMAGSLLYSVVFLLVCYIVLKGMYRRKIFWKV